MNTVPVSGSAKPASSANPQFTNPAINPFVEAMNVESAPETERVRLLSMAQHRQAAEMANGPTQPEALALADGHDSTKPPATMDSMPNTTRRPAFSLKTTHASKAVNTASRFNKREAVAPLVWVRPNIRATGPRTPPKAMAPSSQGHSRRPRPDRFQPPSRNSRTRARPIPLPR